jgi:hypothetical protein
MKYASRVISATGIALLLASAAPALARESGSDTSGSGHSVEASTTVNVETGDKRGDRGFFNLPKLKFMASSTSRVEKNDDNDHHASSTEKRIEKTQEKAGDSIDKRIESLQKLSARLAGMKLLSADALASIQASLAAEIKVLTDLKAKIGSSTATTTLKADVESITKANRTYLLVMPKAQIAAAASRLNAVVIQFQALTTKLEARIATVAATGADVTVSNAALADFKAKIADAKVQADAAVALTANLQADNGDKTVLAANNAKLKEARAKLELAQKDLAAARADAAKIYGVVKGKEGKDHQEGNVNATTSVETH